MHPKRILMGTAVLLVAFFSLSSLLQIASSAPQATTLLYDSTVGTTLSEQNFSYLAINPQPPFSVQASQSYSNPITLLDTAQPIERFCWVHREPNHYAQLKSR